MPPVKRKRPRQPRQQLVPTQPGVLGPTSDPRTASEIPASDAQGRIQKYWKWINQSLEAQQEFAADYIEAMKILANDPAGHYTEKALKELEREGRPALIINYTTPTVMTVAGLQRRGRELAKFLPFDPDDAAAVELLEYLYRWYYDQLGLRNKDSEVFLRKYAAGAGFWKLSYDTEEDPRGVPRVDSVNPLNVLWDPNWPDAPWKESEYVIHAEWRTVDRAMDEWPENADEIRRLTGEWINHWSGGTNQMGDSQAPHRFSWDPQTQRVRIAQVWYKRVRTAKVALWSDGTVESDPDLVDAAEAAARENTRDARGVLQIIRRPVTQVWFSHLLDQIELSHDPSPLPFHELPLIPSIGYNFWKRPTGAVKYMRDPQREKNVRRNSITEIASRAAHSGFFNKKGRGAAKDDLENFSSGAAVVVEYDEEVPQRIEPPTLPQYLVYLDQQSSGDIRFVVNVNDEILGQTSAQTVSGRAIEARQRGGVLTQEIFFDSFAIDQAQLARLLIEMIRETTNPEEARRILGALAQRTENEQLAVTLAQPVEALDHLLSRAFNAKFDVVVTTQPWDPSGKIATLKTLTDLFQIAPPPPNILIEVMTQAGAIPKSIGDKWLAQIQQPPPVEGGAPGSPAVPGLNPEALLGGLAGT